METITDPRTVFSNAVQLGGSVVAAVRPDQLDGPTPCGEYNVRQLLGHLVAVLERVAVLGQGGDGMAVPAEASGIADDGWQAAWEAAAADVEKAWSDDAAMARTYTFPWAVHDGAATLAMYTSELSVHTWDLARATGQRPAWDDDVLTVALASIQVDLPGGNRAAMFDAMRETMPPELRDFTPPFAEVVPVPDDAPLIDRLVAWTGRRP